MPFSTKETFRSLCCLFLGALAAGQAYAQILSRPTLPAQDRITAAIDDRATVVRPGNRPRLAQLAWDRGAVDPRERMERMILVLTPDAAQRQALEDLLEAQQDPASPLYHQWLTPESFGREFGISDADLGQLTGWLEGHGFSVEEVTAGRRSIVFSGTVGAVEQAFHTQIHHYQVEGVLHRANATDPEIPAALAGVVEGVVSLHDFPRKMLHSGYTPAFTSGSSHYLAPADFATIYDVAPLYTAGFDGTGQSIAIVGRTNIKVADVTQFRSQLGLPLNNPTVVVNGTDPGVVSSDEAMEALLDTEWSGAVARKAGVLLVVSGSTKTTDGVDLSAQYIVNHNLAPVMSTSFGSCEADMGTAENQFWASLWQQAAAQGITAFVSSGDSGAAGCDDPSATKGTGRAVSGLCSTPYNVCVGGTQFNDTATPSVYWGTTNNGTNSASALSYIPEVAWNESASVTGGSELWSTGGGASTIYSKPSWQTGTGVPADAHRDIPDVSLSAAGHDAYLVVASGKLYAVSGTSASSPSFAGLMALVAQKTGARQGNANPTFYALAARQAAGGAAVFHDVTSGNNTVPGTAGFTAGTGYDQVTGLGSVDAFVMANHWGDIVATPNFQVGTGSSAVSLTTGATATVQVTVTVSGGFSAAVALSASGLPTGVTASFAPATLAAPGSGTSTLTLTAASSATSGTYSIVINGTGNGLTRSAAVTLTVQAPAATLTLTLSPATVTVPQGGTGSVTLTVTGAPRGSQVWLSVAGLPAGVTVGFVPAASGTAGTYSGTLIFAAAQGATVATSALTFTARAGTLSKSQPLTLIVAKAPFSVSLSTSTLAVKAGSTASLTATVNIQAGFTSAIALSLTGLPQGVSATLTPSSVSGSGLRTSTLKFTVAANAAVSKAVVTLTATGGGVTESAPLTLSVTH